MKVQIYMMDENADSTNVGHLSLRDGKIVPSTPKLARLASHHIFVGDKGDEEIDPRKEPEKYLRHLHQAWHSPYLTAMKAEH